MYPILEPVFKEIPAQEWDTTTANQLGDTSQSITQDGCPDLDFQPRAFPLTRRGSLLPGADDGCQEQEDDRPQIQKHLGVLLQHALQLRRAVGKLRVCNSGDGIGHFVNPFS